MVHIISEVLQDFVVKFRCYYQQHIGYTFICWYLNIYVDVSDMGQF